MSFSRRLELVESSIWNARPSFLLPSVLQKAEMEVDEQLGFTLDILSPSVCPNFSLINFPLTHLHCFDSWAADLAVVLPPQVARNAESLIQLKSLSSRVAALEAEFDRAVGRQSEARDRKIKWTADIKGVKGEESNWKCKVVAKEKAGGERSVKYTKNVEGKGRYTFETSTVPASTGRGKESESDKKGVKKKGAEAAKLVEIKEDEEPGAVMIRKVFARRVHNDGKRKKKQLSPQDAALIIQMNFRAYLVRRSQVLRDLRELAIAKAKLKEIRSIFSSLFYRQRMNRDAEERQRFTEKIIVLLLTVEAIQGSDYMIRAAKKSIIDELELKLEVVDPQSYQTGKLGSMRQRKFDLPENVPIGREIARTVAHVVEVIDEHASGSSA